MFQLRRCKRMEEISVADRNRVCWVFHSEAEDVDEVENRLTSPKLLWRRTI